MKLLGRKIGMTKRFDKAGNLVVCTAIEIQSNVVVQVKTVEKDGYEALQMAADKLVVKDQRTLQKRVSKPLLGHFAKNNVAPHRVLSEVRCSVEGFEPGQEVSLEALQDLEFVDVMGTSKGKGYQGVMKRHGFSGGPAAHGSGFHRLAGSTGMRSTPGRCLPGGKKAGRMGGDRVTTQSLRVVAVDLENRLLFVNGAIPGANTGIVHVSGAIKKQGKKKS